MLRILLSTAVFLGFMLMNPLIFRWCHKRRQTWGFRAA